MVEIIEETKVNEGEKKNEAVVKKTGADGGGKKDGASASAGTTIVLKLDLHCDGCAKKVRRSILHFEGVEDVKADYVSGKLTVKGKVDPTWLRERVEIKTKRKVELLSPPPKKDATAVAGTAGDKKSDDKDEKKAEEENKSADDKKKPNEPTFSIVDLKISLHCEGCAHKIKRIITRIKGVEEVSVALPKNLVTVEGTMDVKELINYLKDKLKRNVDILIPKKEDGGDQKKTKEDDDNNKEKDGGGGSGDGDKNESGKNNNKKNDDETKAATSNEEGEGSKSMETKEHKIEIVNKMDYYSNNANTYYAMPTYNASYMNQDHGDHGYDHTGYVMEYSHAHNYVPPSPPPTYLNTANMFSDEDPNGCSIM